MTSKNITECENEQLSINDREKKNINKEDTADSDDPSSCTKAKIWIKTLALIMVWVNFGMAFTILPSTLPDMVTRFNVTVEQMSRALMAVSYGGIIGGPIGVLIDRFYARGDLIMGVMLLLNSVIVSLKPWIPKLSLLATLNFLDGMIWTAINAVGNVVLVNLWGRKSSSPMQAVHLGFPLGSMVAALIALPFVTQHNLIEKSDYDSVSTNISDSSYANMTFVHDLPNMTFANDLHHLKDPTNWTAQELKEQCYTFEETYNKWRASMHYLDNSRVEIAYCLIGISVFSISVVFFLFQCVSMPTTGNGVNPESKIGLGWRQVLSPSTWSPGNSRFGACLVAAMMFFYFLQYGGMIPSMVFQVQFAVDANFTNEQEGALMNSSAWLAGTLGRAISILIAYCVSPRVMIFGFVCSETITSLLLVIWGINNKIAFWVLSCLYAFFRDPIWPCGYTWTDQYIMLFAIVVGLLDAASRTSAALMSWLMGYTYTYASIYSIYYISAVLGGILCIHIFLVNAYAGNRGNRYVIAHQVSGVSADEDSTDGTLANSNTEP